jgi:hypothetical protein
VNLIQEAAAEAFASILDDIGVPITIGEEEYQAAISMGGVQIDLEEGGFSQDGSLTVRMLVAHLPDPAPTQNSAMTIGDLHTSAVINDPNSQRERSIVIV